MAFELSNLIIIIIFYFFTIVYASCPLYEEVICANRGSCNVYSQCECSEGFQGYDCSRRKCPMGHSWTMGFNGTDQAHTLTECSDMGLCDYETGRCECREGFEGRACERLSCPDGCDLKGQCMNLRQLAEINYWTEYQPVYENMWDANQIYGCYCNQEWFSWDCSQPVCPTGDDPITENQGNEVQLLYCFANTGSLQLRFGEYTTRNMDVAKLNPAKLEYELEKLHSITDVTVTVSSGNKVCSTDTDVVTIVEFNQEFGPDYRVQHDFGITTLPPLRVEDSNLDGTIQVKWGGVEFIGYASMHSEKENELCSNRGTCNFIDGTCECYYDPLPRFRSSDGNGNPGVRGDCGSMDPIDDAEMSTCAGEIMCQGHGECDENFRCICEAGWTGGDCVYRTCPEGPSWFDFPRQEDEAHTTWTVCSSRGECDVDNGECECQDNFEGAACELMACPEGCSGRGQCLTVRALAEKISEGEWEYGTILNSPATWDADRIQGCLCDEGYTGYNCERRTCPYGDDPNSYGQDKEMQLLECCAGDGTFQLSWQSSFYTTKTTVPVPWNATASQVEEALEQLSNIDDATVTYSASSGSACLPGSLSSQIVYVTDLPDPAYVGQSFDIHINLTSGPTEEDAIKVMIYGGSEDFVLSSSNIVFDNEEDTTRTITITPVAAGEYTLTYVIKGSEIGRYMFADKAHGVKNITVNTTVYSEYEIQPPKLGKFIMSSATPFEISIGELPPQGQNVSVLVEAKSGGDVLSFSPSIVTWYSYSSTTQIFNAVATSPGTFNVSFSLKQTPTLSYTLASSYRKVTATWGAESHKIIPPVYPTIPIHDESPELFMKLSSMTPNGLIVKPCGQGLTFEPSRIVFAPGEKEASFKIFSGSSYGIKTINYTISGNDTENFKNPGESSMEVNDVNVMLVTFLTENGNLRAITPLKDDLKDAAFGLGKLNVFTDGETTRRQTSVEGTTEFIECSGRGLCNYETGLCECEIGYRSSDGNGRPGAKGECGYRIRM